MNPPTPVNLADVEGIRKLTPAELSKLFFAPPSTDNTLLCVLAHSEASPALARHWPWWEKSGYRILGVDRQDTQTIWPAKVDTVSIGKEEYLADGSQIRRFLALLDYLLRHETEYDRFIVIEWDCLLVRPITEIPSFGIAGTLAGHRSPGFHGQRFFHCPWAFSAATAEIMRDSGRLLAEAGLFEQGFLDRWLGLLSDLYEVPFHKLQAYSQNALDQPIFIEDARKAIAAGAVAIHGVKTAAQLAALSENLAYFPTLFPPAA